MIFKLKKNPTIQEFCTNDLKEKAEYSRRTVLLMCNFSFLLKCSLMQVLLVAFVSQPAFGFGCLILTELVYSAINLAYYIKNRHLKNFVLLIPKVVQSGCIIAVEYLILSSYLKLSDSNLDLSEETQHRVIKVILASTIIEYVMLLLTILVIVRLTIINRKLQQQDPEFKAYSVKKNQFLIQKIIRKPMQIEDEKSKVVADISSTRNFANQRIAPVVILKKAANQDKGNC